MIVQPLGANISVIPVVLTIDNHKVRYGAVIDIGAECTTVKKGDIVQWIKQGERPVRGYYVPAFIVPERDVYARVTDPATRLAVQAEFRRMVGDEAGAQAYEAELKRQVQAVQDAKKAGK